MLLSTHISASGNFHIDSSLSPGWPLSASLVTLISSDTSPQSQGTSADERQRIDTQEKQWACEHAIHKATGKRNSVMLVNLLSLLRTLDSLGSKLSRTIELDFRTYIQRITQTQQSRHHTTYLSIQESFET